MITLIPRSRALREHGRDPRAVLDGHRDDVHARVIQVSMTSFCLAGSGSVGPSQISLTPSLLGRLLGPLPARR